MAWLAVTACGIWLGTILFLGGAVAPAVFRFLESKTQAGLLNGIILHKMNIIEAVCGLVVLLISFYFYVRYRGRLRMIQLAGSILLLLNLAYYSRVVTPQMEELKTVIGSFDVPKTEDVRPERSEFESLHKQYSALVSVNLVLLLTLSFLITHSSDREKS